MFYQILIWNGLYYYQIFLNAGYAIVTGATSICFTIIYIAIVIIVATSLYEYKIYKYLQKQMLQYSSGYTNPLPTPGIAEYQ